MREPLADLPIVTDNPQAIIRSIPWGGMACTYGQMKAGTDFTPLFQGLPDDLCPCPHWGYVLKGAIRIRYTDGQEEEIEAGEMFYLPSGHTGWCGVDTAWVEFSPEKAYNEVGAHVSRKLQS